VASRRSVSPFFRSRTECVGIHAVKKAIRFEALEPVRQGVREHFGFFSQGSAAGLLLRHDHGSVYMGEDFQNEIQFLGIESSPAFVRQPEATAALSGSSERLGNSYSGFTIFAISMNFRPLWSSSATAITSSGSSGAWANRTPAQARSDFELALPAAA
jgi:hypothetical protein